MSDWNKSGTRTGKIKMTSQTAHTPGKLYRVEPGKQYPNTALVYRGRDLVSVVLPKDEAERMATALNSHDDLVEALKDHGGDDAYDGIRAETFAGLLECLADDLANEPNLRSAISEWHPWLARKAKAIHTALANAGGGK